jgi:hypothetical protein
MEKEWKKEWKKKSVEGFVVAFVERIPMGIFSMVLENLCSKGYKNTLFYEQS